MKGRYCHYPVLRTCPRQTLRCLVTHRDSECPALRASRVSSQSQVSPLKGLRLPTHYGRSVSSLFFLDRTRESRKSRLGSYCRNKDVPYSGPPFRPTRISCLYSFYLFPFPLFITKTRFFLHFRQHRPRSRGCLQEDRLVEMSRGVGRSDPFHESMCWGLGGVGVPGGNPGTCVWT